MTIVEVVIAVMVLALASLAVLGIVDAATKNDYRAQQSQVLNDRLQQEMEKIKQVPYGQVALTGPLTGAAGHSSDPANPAFRVSADGTQFNVNRTGSVGNWGLAYNGGHSNESGGTVSVGTIDPGPTPFQSGNVSGHIYRYVVWEPEASCANCAHPPNSDVYNGQRVEWFKHVVIAITLDQAAAGGTQTYQEIQSDIGNPDAGQGSGSGGGPSENNSTPWTFWLTDTSCDHDSRQSISGDHQTHNTLGRCTDGQHTGTTSGAPDLMFPLGAPCVNNDCTIDQPLYDYATDVEPTQNAGQDKGLQEVVPSGNGCLLTNNGGSGLLTLPPSESTPQAEVHKWVSPQTTGSSILLDGSGELDLWTQTINGAVNKGRICIWLFTRSTSGGERIDTPAVNVPTGTNSLPTDGCDPSETLAVNVTYFTCTYPGGSKPWPNGNWSEVHVPLNFNAITIPPQSRLGVAIGVERGGSCTEPCQPEPGLQFMYDHPTYDSRLVVNTHSSLPF